MAPGDGGGERRPRNFIHRSSLFRSTHAGGHGWDVTSDPADAEHPGPAFVTSYGWCQKSQLVWLCGGRAGPGGPPTDAYDSAAPPAICVEEWHRGTGPNYADE